MATEIPKPLEVTNVTKKYGEVLAVDDVSMAINRDEITSIVGPNGAGKTTFVELITGHTEPTEGQVEFKGKDIGERSFEDRARAGIVKSFQEPEIYHDLTVLDHIYIGLVTDRGENSDFLRPLSIRDDLYEEAMQILTDFGLADEKDTIGENLPYGKRKILDVAIAFASGPEILLMDEPTSGVATGDSRTIMETITSALEDADTTVVFIEHDMEIVRDFSDRVIVLFQGRILEDGTPAEALASEDVKRYLIGGEEE